LLKGKKASAVKMTASFSMSEIENNKFYYNVKNKQIINNKFKIYN